MKNRPVLGVIGALAVLGCPALPQAQSAAKVVEVDAAATSASASSEPIPAFQRPEAGRLSAPAGVSPSTIPPSEIHMAPASPPPANLFTDKVVVLATWKGGTFTNRDLTSTLALRTPITMPNVTPENVRKLGAPTLRDLVREFVYERLLFERARDEGITTQTADVKKRIEDYRLMNLGKQFYDKVMARRVDEMGEKQLRDRYEADKASKYTLPEKIEVQEIYLSYYENYRVQNGDTLEGIAKRISGNAKAAARILRNDSMKYPRLSPSTVTGQVPTLEVRPGEPLMVPIPDDLKTTKSRTATEARAKAAAGEDFTKLAEKYSDAAGGSKTAAFAPDFNGMNPQMSAFIQKGKKGDISEVIASPHGLHIIRIADRQPTRTLTFDEVKGKILVPEESRTANTELVRKQVLDELREKYGLKVHTDTLKTENPDAGDKPLPPSTAIVSGGGFSYTLEEFRRDLLPTMKSWTGMSFQERLDLARSAPPVVRYLVSREAAALGIDREPDYADAMRSKEIIEVTTEYLNRQRKQGGAVSDSELREYYSEHADRYATPGKVTLREITKRVNFSQPPAARAEAIEKAKKELQQVRAQIKTVDDFEQLARRESQAIATRSRGGNLGEVRPDFRGPAVRNVIDQLKPGEVSEPFLHGAEVVILLLEKSTPPTPQPFEDVINRVRTDYNREALPKKRAEDRDKSLKEAGFELKF